MKNFINFSALCLFGVVAVQGQSRELYLEKAAQPGANFFEITKEIERKLEEGNLSDSGKISSKLKSAETLKSEIREAKQYQRWKYAHAGYINPDGTMGNLSQQLQAVGALDASGRVNAVSTTNTPVNNDIYNANVWTNVGIQSLPEANGKTHPPQMGRVNNFFRLNNATNKNAHVLFLATPNSGVFKSSDNGATWVPKLDHIAYAGATDMRGADDLTTANYIGRPIYVSTGDFDSGDVKSIGVLKSVDGGETFQSTNLSYTAISNEITSNLIVIDDNTVVVADKIGIRRTTNGGTTWTLVHTAQVGDGTIGRFVRSGNNIMATTKLGGIYYSTDAGVTWAKVRANDNTSTDVRRSVAVSNTGVFYTLHVEKKTATFSVFKPQDKDNVNIFEKISEIKRFDNQEGYNLCLLVDGDLVMANGVDGFYSNDLGKTSFKSLPWDWDPTSGGSYVHADHHAVGKISDGEYWDANDGGLSYISCDLTNYTEPTVTYKTNGMINAMIHSVAINPIENTTDYIIGNQDNDALSNVGNTWHTVNLGDGIETAVNYNDPNIRYATSYGGDIRRSNTSFILQLEGNAKITLLENNRKLGSSFFRFPFEMNKITPTILYAAAKDIYKLTDDTTKEDSDSKIVDGVTVPAVKAITQTTMNAGFSSGNFIAGLSTHANVIVANTNDEIRKSINISDKIPVWTTISFPEGLDDIKHIDFKQSKDSIMYLINSNTSANEKVYKTINNGKDWTNITGNLPNVALNKILLYQNQTTEVLFLATDVGMYYKTAASTNWFKLGSGLPNVKITDIEINYINNQLIASSYGRGLWRINLNNSNQAGSQAPEDQNLNFEVVPIPANQYLKIQLPKPNESYQYQIYNAVGGIMQTGVLPDDLKIDTSLLSNAYYVLRIYNQTENYTKNIIIKH